MPSPAPGWPATWPNQTIHRKRLIGGYLSRVSTQQKTFHLNMPVLHALITLSEGTELSAEARARAVDSRDRFLRSRETCCTSST